MRFHRFVPMIVMTVLVCTPVIAQINLSGIYDFEVKKGGGDSAPALNDLQNSFPQLNVGRLHLFVDAPLDEDIWVAAKFSAGSRLTKAPFQLNLELLHVTFANLAGEYLNISAGKILTPFGLFARRQLSTSNPLISDPLFFRYPMNISPQSGYLDSAGVLLAGSLYGGRLGTMYRGGYYVGVEAFGSAGDVIQYSFAVMNAPISSPNTTENLNEELAFHGRVALRPQIWGEIGVSLSHGSFLEKGTVSRVAGETKKFRQQTIGVDLTLSALYYELTAEFLLNTFESPYVVYDFTRTPPYRSGLTSSDRIELTNRELVIDLKIDAPFYPGLYAAVRYDLLRFSSIVDPSPASSSFGRSVPWDADATVVAVTVGFKPARGVVIKAGHEWMTIDKTPPPSLDWSGLQLSVSF